MRLYHEIWNARPAWLALSIPERIAYLDRLGPKMKDLTEAGVEPLGVALTESNRGCRYRAVWKMPEGESQIQTMNDILRKAGWHRYFTPVEAWEERLESPVHAEEWGSPTTNGRSE